jgi:hypothetical protein
LRTHRLLGLVLAAWPGLAAAWVSPSAGPIDPVLPFVYAPSQVMFEQAPPGVVAACQSPARAKFWILGKTTRPEGQYLLISGPVWLDEGWQRGRPHREVLVDDDHGQIVLFRNDDSCVPEWLPAAAFNGDVPADEAGIVKSLARDEMARAARVFGGPVGFLRAFDAAGQNDASQFAAVAPLLAGLRQGLGVQVLHRPPLPLPVVMAVAAPVAQAKVVVSYAPVRRALPMVPPMGPLPDMAGAILAMALYWRYRRQAVLDVVSLWPRKRLPTQTFKRFLPSFALLWAADSRFRVMLLRAFPRSDRTPKKRSSTYFPSEALFHALHVPEGRE